MASEEFLQYIRIKSRPRVNWMCSPAFEPPPSLLRAIFGQDITDNELHYYKIQYRKNCKQLVNSYMDRIYLQKLIDGLVSEDIKERYRDSIVSRTVKNIHQSLSQLYGRKHYLKFIWPGRDSVYGELVEFIINFAIKAFESAKLSWSEWFTVTSEGQQLMYFILHGRSDERRYGLAVFFIYLFSIYFMSGYDDVYFTKEIFEILPSLEPIFERYPLLRDPIVRVVADKSSGFILMYTLKQIMERVYHVPKDLLNGFFTDEHNHIIEEIQIPLERLEEDEDEKNDS